MIGQFISLYRARNDTSLAKRIASEMVVDGVIDRAGWPLAIAKFWMAVGIAITTILMVAFLSIGIFSHWSLAIPALPLGGLIYGTMRLWRGINAGVERITNLAKLELTKRTVNPQIPNFGKTTLPDNEHQA